MRHITKASHVCRSKKRLFLLDYDGTLNAEASHASDDRREHITIDPKPTGSVLKLLSTLSRDPANTIYIISGRARKSLGEWFASVVSCRLRLHLLNSFAFA